MLWSYGAAFVLASPTKDYVVDEQMSSLMKCAEGNLSSEYSSSSGLTGFAVDSEMMHKDRGWSVKIQLE